MSKLKSMEDLFAGRHFERNVIILCVRWYLRYKLSLRDLVEMMAERGLELSSVVQYWTGELMRHRVIRRCNAGKMQWEELSRWFQQEMETLFVPLIERPGITESCPFVDETVPDWVMYY